MAADDRPPSRPSRPPAPKAGGAAPPAKPGAASARPSSATPAARPSETQKQPQDKVAEAYQDLLKEIVDKKKKAAELRRQPPKKRKSAVAKAVAAVVLPPIAAAVWIFQPFAPPPPEPPRPPDERGAWQMALTDAALQIREWRDSAGSFPADLATAGVLLQGVAFEMYGPEAFTLQRPTRQGRVIVWMDGDKMGLGPRPEPPPPPVVIEEVRDPNSLVAP